MFRIFRRDRKRIVKRMVVTDKDVHNGQERVTRWIRKLQTSLNDPSICGTIRTHKIKKELEKAKKDLTELKHEATLRIQEQKRRK